MSSLPRIFPESMKKQPDGGIGNTRKSIHSSSIFPTLRTPLCGWGIPSVQPHLPDSTESCFPGCVHSRIPARMSFQLSHAPLIFHARKARGLHVGHVVLAGAKEIEDREAADLFHVLIVCVSVLSSLFFIMPPLLFGSPVKLLPHLFRFQNLRAIERDARAVIKKEADEAARGGKHDAVDAAAQKRGSVHVSFIGVTGVPGFSIPCGPLQLICVVSPGYGIEDSTRVFS